MLLLWLIFSLSALLSSCSFVSIDCLFIQHVTLRPLQPITTSQPYNFIVSWSQSLTHVEKHGIALSGYQIQQPSSYLSYGAKLTNTTNTGTNIIVTNKHNATAIVSMQFTIIVLVDSPLKAELIHQVLEPSVLNESSRIESQESFQVNSTLPNLNSSEDLLIRAFLSDFTMTVPSIQSQSIHIQKPVVANNNISLTIQSDRAYSNTISEFTAVILILKASQFNNQLIEYNKQYDAWCSACQQSTTLSSSSLSPSEVRAEECLLSLEHIETYSISSSKKGVSWNITGNEITFDTNRLFWAVYDISCFLTCPDGSYLAIQNSISQCASCSQTCLTCLNLTHCSSCHQNYALQQGSCSQCPNSTYPHEEVCVSCAFECHNCLNSTFCTSCNEGYVLIAGICTNCSLGTYMSGSVCLHCHHTCTACINNATCTQCIIGYDLTAGYCTNCSVGEYSHQNQCLPCSEQCEHCLSQTNCTACHPNYALINGACSNCSVGQFVSEGQCLACSHSCKLCTNLTLCVECITGFELHDGYCTNCSLGQYSTQGICQQCPNGCSQCIDNNICTSCVLTFILNHSTCVYNNAANSTNTDQQQNVVKATQENSRSSLSILPIAITIPIAILIILALFIGICASRNRDFRDKICCCLKQEAVYRSRMRAESASQQQLAVEPIPVIIRPRSRPRQPSVKSQEEEVCPICLAGAVNTVLRCGHQYHLLCIKQWSKKNFNCALCRSSAINPITLKCTKCAKQIGKKTLQTVKDKDTRKVYCGKCRQD